MLKLDEIEPHLKGTYIGKVRLFMRRFGLTHRSPAELESTLKAAGLILVHDPEPPISNGERS